LRYYNPPGDPGGPPDPDAPFGVVRPHTAQEVAFAIKWARENNLPMVPRSGGHSYAGCSTVAGLVINSSAMQCVSVKHGLIEAGGGALFGNLLDTLRHIKTDCNTGCYTITHGRCRGVGLSAYLMGGGLSLDSPYAGMGCDRVEKVEIVLADGRCVIASENDIEHRGLFWAVRGGGGGNLGFATKWWLNPLAVQEVVAFSGTWRLSDNARSVFRSLLRTIEKAPDRMGAQIIVSTSPATVASPWRYEIRLACLLHGSREEFDAILGPTLAEADRAESNECKFNDCSSKVCLELPYWDAQEFFEIQAVPNRYQETSVFAPEVSDAFIDEMFRIWPTWPASVAAARWSIYRLGGKVSMYAPDATAYVHRPYPWVLSTDIDWSGGDNKQRIDDNLKWQRDVQNSFSTMLGTPGSFYNFPDPGLDEPARAYWGNNLPRLREVKRRYDPDSVFTPPRNQGINS
jgi:FAD/FMN-containing dehydrogenase